MSFPAETRERILADYAAGTMPVAEIARKYRVSASYPNQLAKRYGVKRGDGSRFRIQTEPPQKRAHDDLPEVKPAASADEIRELAGRGWKRWQIAAKLRCPYREVDAALESRPGG